MSIVKELKTYLSDLFPHKCKDVFYKKIDEHCFMLAKVHNRFMIKKKL